MSDSMNGPFGLVVGTAGHIDHGKTSLIRFLTGIDTDRLAEEKKRGISIDLGFAHLELPNGSTVSFIDVPGHERFIKNMLAGAGGIQAVMLIVAADESVMPQTREHFDICRLLGIQHGFIVLTKTDLASPEQIGTARSDIASLVKGSFLAASPILEVSAKTGVGMPAVVSQLAKLAGSFTPPVSARAARLAVDRSFAVTGFGAVATGTLLEGKVQVGDTLILHPSQVPVRIRGLQVHGRAVKQAHPGQRVAVNVAGLESSDMKRGFVLAKASGLEPTRILDATVDWLEEGTQQSRRPQEVLLHVGTKEIAADLKVLNQGRADAPALARLWLSEPVLALPGDRFILRRPSPSRTVAGGVVVDPFPVLRLNRSRTVDRLSALAAAGDAARIQLLVEESTAGRTVTDLVRMTGYEPAEVAKLIHSKPGLFLDPATQRALSRAWLAARRTKLVDWLRDFHVEHPSAAGATLSSARQELAPDLAKVVFEGFPAVRVQGELISLAAHKAAFSEQEGMALSRMEFAFRKAAYQPPTVDEVLRAALPDQKKSRALLEMLVKDRKLVRVSDDLIFHAEVLAHLRNSLSLHKGKLFSVPDFKGWTQMSRKFAIPVLEYLDREKVTRRVGDQRIIA